MTGRPLCSVLSLNKVDGKVKAECSQRIPMPDVLNCPIRDDLVSFIHDQVRKNKIQAQGRAKNAGVQVSALSWGTGRAVARIPRVKGGGTHRSGQGAYGNMCRGGHNFNTLVTYRKWHRKVNIKQKRFACASAIAASSISALVMSRGHAIDNVNEIPLVIDENSEIFSSLNKTKVASEVLAAIGANDDVDKSKDSKKIRSGKGKKRNRRYVQKKGPLLIHDFESDHSFVKAFRNVPGLDLLNVNCLNILKLAPGGHLGRFIIWTKSAFEKLNPLFGSFVAPSEIKSGFMLPRSLLTNADVSGLINSNKIQSALRPKKLKVLDVSRKVNPFTNPKVMQKLNPYARIAKRFAMLNQNEILLKKAGKVVKTA